LDGRGYKFLSLKGEVGAWRYRSREGAVSVGWDHRTVPAEGRQPLSVRGPSQFLGFSIGISEGMLPYMVVVPQWFIVVLSAVLATAPWMRRVNLRFGLRTLLIATTLIAVVLATAACLRLW
jgi:hypothetical protein